MLGHMPPAILSVEINCPDLATARSIADALVARRLAACANIGAPIESLYRWKGRVERAAEVPLTLKTAADRFPALAEAARALHPYETPSILAHPVAAVTDDYRAWVIAETGGRSPEDPGGTPR
jgi:periplasmic divalent cation tolerance protein